MVKPILESVNSGRPAPNPYKSAETTGIGKVAQDGPVEVRAPGPKTTPSTGSGHEATGSGSGGSGLVGDHIGDTQNHGGDGQAVYAFAREDLDAWELRLDRTLTNGFFGENLTTRGVEVNDARIGERWRLGDEVVLEVTCPRIPCSTFRGWMGEKGWLKTFTQVARPGAYLKVVTPGRICGGDTVEVTGRPDHDVTVSLMYRALTTDRDLLPRLLAADAFLDDEVKQMVAERRIFRLG